MTVQELIEDLKKMDPKADIILSTDGEGNKFSPLLGISKDRYFPDPKMPWSVEPDKKGIRKCLILWPAN